MLLWFAGVSSMVFSRVKTNPECFPADWDSCCSSNDVNTYTTHKHGNLFPHKLHEHTISRSIVFCVRPAEKVKNISEKLYSSLREPWEIFGGYRSPFHSKWRKKRSCKTAVSQNNDKYQSQFLLLLLINHCYDY